MSGLPGDKEMSMPTELALGIVGFGGIVVGFIGTISAALITTKSKTTISEGEQNRAWVEMQLETMQRTIDSLSAEVKIKTEHYEKVIADMQANHNRQRREQDGHCRREIDRLQNQVNTLMNQVSIYTGGVVAGAHKVEELETETKGSNLDPP